MSSNFGEIVELNSRSFVTDGEEWSLDTRYSIKTENEDSLNQGKPCDYFFVACGKVISDFAAAFLISETSQVLNRYYIVLNPKDNEQYAKKKFTYTLFQLSKNTLLLVCDQLPHIYFAHHLLDKIKPYLDVAEHTVVLTGEHMSCYKPRGPSQAFLRCLSTRACSLTAQAPNLELPNTISGFPAATLSWCQAKHKSAVVYAIYTESTILDSITAQPLHQLLRTFRLTDLPLSSTDTFKKYVNEAELQHSNLYL